MSDYINRKSLIENLNRFAPEAYSRAVDLIICKEPAVDAVEVVEVRHGKWIDPENDDRYTAWHCSRCDYPVKTLGGRPNCRYCPTCGARMDKEDKHG